jgi:hypothetical protein
METTRERLARGNRNENNSQATTQDNRDGEDNQTMERASVQWSNSSLGDSEVVLLNGDNLNSRSVAEDSITENPIEASSQSMRPIIFDDARRALIIPYSAQNNQQRHAPLTELDLYLGHTSSWQNPLVAGLGVQIPGNEDSWTPTDAETETLLNTPDDLELEQRESNDEIILSVVEILSDVSTIQPVVSRGENTSIDERQLGLRPIPAETSEALTKLTSIGVSNTYDFSLRRREALNQGLFTDMARHETQREAYLEREYGFSTYLRENPELSLLKYGQGGRFEDIHPVPQAPNPGRIAEVTLPAILTTATQFRI